VAAIEMVGAVRKVDGPIYASCFGNESIIVSKSFFGTN
jgi:hypothetical protein